SRPASGQVPAQTANPAPSGPEYYPAVVPAVTYYAPVTASTPWGGQRGQDPELDKLLAEEGRLDRDAANLIGEYARTEDEAQRVKTKAKLAEALQKQFDLQQKRRDLEVAHIEAQVKKLREVMRKRGEARQTIIDKRLDQLLREADGLGWTP